MKVFLILCLAVTSLSVFAEPYEVLLHTQPQGADAYISLIHPFNAPGMTNYGIANNYFDCEPEGVPVKTGLLEIVWSQ